MADRTWTVLTNHAHVLLCLTREPELRVPLEDSLQLPKRPLLHVDAGHHAMAAPLRCA